MDIFSDAKSKSKALLIKYGISELTLENMIYVIENQGFEILEYSQYLCDDSVWAVIERLNLVVYAQSGKAFAYQHGKAKLLFICNEMTADEKLYALAHEEGHILCGHLSNGVCEGSLIEQEHLANEVAHYLLNPPLHIKFWIKILERKKYVIAIISVIGILAIALIIVTTIQQIASYYGNCYVTENGTKYHEEDCMIIKDKTNIRRLTEEDYKSGEYEPCQVCLPD